MPYRSNVFAKGHYYHIYNRGAGRERIFFNEGNFAYLLRLVQRYRQNCEIMVIAYCLMPNHYHFLLRQDADISISRFINLLFNAYTQAVNRQQGRSGTLFEGRFKHVAVEREEYLVHLARYIHLNPVRANLVAQPEDWLYSNYAEWIGVRSGTLKDARFIQEHFSSPEAYKQFVLDYQDYTRVPEQIRRYI